MGYKSSAISPYSNPNKQQLSISIDKWWIIKLLGLFSLGDVQVIQQHCLQCPLHIYRLVLVHITKTGKKDTLCL